MLRALCRAHTSRFAVVGLAMTALHLAVFRLVLPWSVPEIANVIAFLTATQVNFALSYFWTWTARRPVGRETAGYVLRRALLFNGSAALAFGVNAAVFSVVLRVAGLGPTQSAVVATVASAAASFLLSSRLVFTRRKVLAAADLRATAGQASCSVRPPAPAPSAEWGRAPAPRQPVLQSVRPWKVPQR